MGLKELGEKLQATIAVKVAIKLSLAYGFQTTLQTPTEVFFCEYC